MRPTLEQLKSTLSGLPDGERAELAQYLLRSLEPEEEGAKAEWLALAEQRMAEVRAGRVAGIPAEEVLNAPREPSLAAALQPRDEWERGLLEAARDCGVSLPNSALSSEGLYE